MRWVKASEQLPEINKNVIMRFPWHDNTIVLDEGKLKPKEERDNQLWFSTNNYGSIPEREDGLEWLDESTPTQSGESMEEAIRQLIISNRSEPNIGCAYGFTYDDITRISAIISAQLSTKEADIKELVQGLEKMANEYKITVEDYESQTTKVPFSRLLSVGLKNYENSLQLITKHKPTTP